MVLCKNPDFVDDSSTKIPAGKTNTDSHKVKLGRGRQSIDLEFVDDESGKTFEVTINISDVIVKFKEAIGEVPKKTNSTEKLAEKNTSERLEKKISTTNDVQENLNNNEPQNGKSSSIISEPQRENQKNDSASVNDNFGTTEKKSERLNVLCDTPTLAKDKKYEVSAKKPVENENVDATLLEKLSKTLELVNEFSTTEKNLKNPAATPTNNPVDLIPSWEDFRKNFSTDFKLTMKPTKKKTKQTKTACRFRVETRPEKSSKSAESTAKSSNEDGIEKTKLACRTVVENCQKDLCSITDLLERNNEALDELSSEISENIKPAVEAPAEEPSSKCSPKKSNTCPKKFNFVPITAPDETVESESFVDRKENETMKKKLSDIDNLIKEFIAAEKELKNNISSTDEISNAAKNAKSNLENQNKIESIENTNSNGESAKILLKNINEISEKLSKEISAKIFEGIDLRVPIESPEQSNQKEKTSNRNQKDENAVIETNKEKHQEHSKLGIKPVKLPTAPVPGRQRESQVRSEIPAELFLPQPTPQPIQKIPSRGVSSRTRSNYQDFNPSVYTSTPINLKNDPFCSFVRSPNGMKIRDPYEEDWNTYSRGSSCSTVNRTKKFNEFISNPRDTMPVTSLPGIGQVYGQRLKCAGIDSVGKMHKQYAKLGGDETAFKSWLKNTAGMNSRWASDCFDALNYM